MNWSRSCDENVAGTLSMQIIALRGDSPLAFITWLKHAQTTTTKPHHLSVKTMQFISEGVVTNLSLVNSAPSELVPKGYGED